MNPARTSKALRRLTAGIAAGALVLVTALPAFAETPTGVDEAALRQAAIDQASATMASVPGVGLGGPAISIYEPIVQAIDIKVVASPNATPDNTSQTASDTAALGQQAAATPGTATAGAGGIAFSGPAISVAIPIVQQINIQIIAGWVPAGGVSQAATNDAALTGTTAAKAGDAAAGGLGSAGYSGAATAISADLVAQRNIQVFVGTDPNATDAVAQTSDNTATGSGETLGQTGAVVGSGGGLATSGAATNLRIDVISQANELLNF